MAYKAFVSSTFEDLRLHREAAINSLRQAGFFVDPMEEWTAASDDPKRFSQDRLEGCDLCVLLVALRRGHVPEGEGMSITQLEYLAARERSIGTLVFMLDEDAPWPRRHDELDKDPELRPWRAELLERHGVSFFGHEPSGLEIAPALTRWLTEKAPRGEVAADDGPIRVNIDRLPAGGRHFVAREDELRRLDDAWTDDQIDAISIVAWGGVGKSALVDEWLKAMRADGWRGAHRVYGWSFYSQGTEERLTSADAFIDDALRWFGDPDPSAGSARDRGLRLAEFVRRQRTLMVLDGVEPLQQPPGTLAGRLKDPALAALIKSLARSNDGLLVLSTREAIEDVVNLEDASAPRLDLGTLSDDDGAALLDLLGVRGTLRERQAASADYKGHALALSLLGKYLVKACGGEIRQLPEVELDVADEVAQGGHAWRVIAAYERWLGEREVSVLRLLGLFDRPAEPEALEVLRAAPVVESLNDGLVDLYDRAWNIALSHLRDCGLLAEEGGTDLDAHPLVRAYFGHQLEHRHLSAWQAGHERLYEHYKNAVSQRPDTLDEMMPLYAAVVHGCRAGKPKQAYDEVYWPRIRRENEGRVCIWRSARTPRRVSVWTRQRSWSSAAGMVGGVRMWSSWRKFWQGALTPRPTSRGRAQSSRHIESALAGLPFVARVFRPVRRARRVALLALFAAGSPGPVGPTRRGLAGSCWPPVLAGSCWPPVAGSPGPVGPLWRARRVALLAPFCGGLAGSDAGPLCGRLAGSCWPPAAGSPGRMLPPCGGLAGSCWPPFVAALPGRMSHRVIPPVPSSPAHPTGINPRATKGKTAKAASARQPVQRLRTRA